MVQDITKKGIQQEADADDGHGPPQHPTRDFQGDKDTHGTDKGIQPGFGSHAVVDGLIFNDVIAHHKDSHQGKKDVQHRWPALGGFARERIFEKDQDIGEQDVKPQKVLGVHWGCGAIHVKKHHKDAHGRDEIEPGAGDGTACF